MRKDDPQINLRIPPGLKERIQQEAKKNRRTQTAEIIARLQESFEEKKAGTVKLDEDTRRELLTQLLAEFAEQGLRRMEENRLQEDREQNEREEG